MACYSRLPLLTCNLGLKVCYYTHNHLNHFLTSRLRARTSTAVGPKMSSYAPHAKICRKRKTKQQRSIPQKKQRRIYVSMPAKKRTTGSSVKQARPLLKKAQVQRFDLFRHQVLFVCNVSAGGFLVNPDLSHEIHLFCFLLQSII